MNVPVILGTARAGRQSEKVARYVLELVQKSGHESELIDVRAHRLAASDNTGESQAAKQLAARITAADALILVVPEYNHGYPGELKLMFDLLYNEYANKPVGLCGVSAGPLGGARGLQALKLTLVSVRMIIALETVYFPQVQDLFDDQGRIKDPGYDRKVQGLITGLARLVKK
jgi:NAD(P)H-dependent FMN reductase